MKNSIAGGEHVKYILASDVHASFGKFLISK